MPEAEESHFPFLKSKAVYFRLWGGRFCHMWRHARTAMLFPSHATRASRSPRFRLCSPKIRKIYACSGWTPSSSNVSVPHVATSWSLWYFVYNTWRKVSGAYQPRCTPLLCRGRNSEVYTSTTSIPSIKDRHIVVHLGYVFEVLIIFATFTSMEILDEVNRWSLASALRNSRSKHH